MNILFDASQCGIGNNGGSKTVIRSAQALAGLGHTVAICGRDFHTWVEHDFPQKLCGYDAVIAVSAQDVQHALSVKATNHFWWMRGWETWNMPESQLIERARSIQMLTNAPHLTTRLNEHDIYSDMVYGGLDLDVWEDTGRRSGDIGTLSQSKHATKNVDFAWEVLTKGGLRSRFLCGGGNKGYAELKKLYQSCSIWLAPTESEGFHQIPAEANLCGCLIVCNDNPHNGMDYATQDTAMVYTSMDGCLECLRNPDYTKVPRMQEYLREVVGDRETNMKRFVEVVGG